MKLVIATSLRRSASLSSVLLDARSSCHQAAVSIVSSLYKQGDTEAERNFVAKFEAELEHFVDVARKAGQKLAAQGHTELEASFLIPGPMVDFARKWYRTLHDDFERETNDSHYVQNVRRIGSEINSMLREVARSAMMRQLENK